MSSTRSSINVQLARLPIELREQIAEHVSAPETTMVTPMDIDASSDPRIPPADGSCPLLALPKELRRRIFGCVLPPKDKIIEPYQTPGQPQAPRSVAPGAAAAPPVPVAPPLHTHLPQITQMLQNQNTPAQVLQHIQNVAAQLAQNVASQQNTQQVGSTVTRSKAAKAKKEAVLAVGDALVLCKQIAAEILVMLYEERTFAINIHEGISQGGIEFLNSGRQRLQYREHFTQVRFKRFEGPDDPFGFSRIKRLMVRIYPAPTAASDQKNSRHDVMHTHFMIRALVKLLKHDGNFGLNRLQIRFVEPRSAFWRPYPWQNTTDFSLRSSSIHGISNIEIILRGLFELRQVHTAACELPPGLYRDKGLSDFIDRLLGVITNKLHPSTMDDEIAVKIESAKDMLDDWVHTAMFSTQFSRTMTAKLEDSDFDDLKEADHFSSYPDEDDYPELPARTDRRKGLAVGCYSPELHDAYEERITSMDDEGVEGRDPGFHVLKNRMSLSVGKRSSDNRSGRACSSRRSERSPPLSSSSRESSGGASLLEMISINDEDTLSSLNLLFDANSASVKHRRTHSSVQRTNNHGSVAKPELRRSERVRARNAADDTRMITDGDTTPSPEKFVPSSGAKIPRRILSRANGSDVSYSDRIGRIMRLFKDDDTDSTSSLATMTPTHTAAPLASINRLVSGSKNQSLSDVLNQTAGNSTQGNKESESSKQNMSEDLIDLEDNEEGDLGLKSNFLA
ncbi:unnamed protein product [Aureobasidium mustum]|uniref:Uncharacterized protein n=1 Tax=Aureobasidium mustum TaxID=2773714 RepID=A0A9N8KC51_9PEZI|nr:unnamed protein product [Aureobasidium mustum]